MFDTRIDFVRKTVHQPVRFSLQMVNFSGGKAVKTNNWMKFSIAIVSLVIGLFVSQKACSQDLHKIDSLKKVLSAKSGIGRFDILFELTREYGNSFKNTEAATFLEEAYQTAMLSGDTVRIVKASRARGQLKARTNLKEAMIIFHDILPVARRHQLMSDLAIIYVGIGLGNTFFANYSEALVYFFRALAVAQEQGDKFYTGVCMHNIGLLYYKLSDNQKALDYYLKAVALKREINDTLRLDRLYVNMGLCYSTLSKWTEAREYFQKAFSDCVDNCDNLKMEAEFGYGRMLILQKDFNLAESHIKTSYQLAVEKKDDRYKSENWLFLGRIELHRKNYRKAKNYFLEAERIAAKAGYRSILSDIYFYLSKSYKEQKLYEQASMYQTRYITYRDSIISESTANSLAVVQVEFEEQQNKVIIAHNNEIIRRQRIQTALISVVAVLLTALTFALFKIIQTKQRVNSKLDHKVRERTLELELSHDALQRSYTEQSNFFYKAVNEIQAPLASLKGISNTLSLDREGRDVLPYASNISRATEKLDQLVSNLTRINGNLNVRGSMISISIFIDAAIEKIRLKDENNRISHTVNADLALQTEAEPFQFLLDLLFELAAPAFHIAVGKEQNTTVIKIKTGKRGAFSEYTSSFIQASKIAAQLNMHARIEKSIDGFEEFHIVVN